MVLDHKIRQIIIEWRNQGWDILDFYFGNLENALDNADKSKLNSIASQVLEYKNAGIKLTKNKNNKKLIESKLTREGIVILLCLKMIL